MHPGLLGSLTTPQGHLAESATVVCPIGLVCPYSIKELQLANQLEAGNTEKYSMHASQHAALRADYVPTDTLTHRRQQLRAHLMELFPGVGIWQKAVDGLDDFLVKTTGDYPRELFVEYVRRRQRSGPIGPGLVFDKERMLAQEFVGWLQSEQKKQAAAEVRRAEAERRAAENIESEERERAARRQALLEHPGNCERCSGKGWWYPTEPHKRNKHKVTCNCPAADVSIVQPPT